MEKILNSPIENVNYFLIKKGNIYLVDQEIQFYDLKAKHALIETIEDIVSQVKIIFEKSEREVLLEILIKQYGNPTHYYDGSTTEKLLEGDFTTWVIRKMNMIPYEKNRIIKLNNNIWVCDDYLIKILDFSTIDGFEGDYTYLIFSRKVSENRF